MEREVKLRLLSNLEVVTMRPVRDIVSRTAAAGRELAAGRWPGLAIRQNGSRVGPTHPGTAGCAGLGLLWQRSERCPFGILL